MKEQNRTNAARCIGRMNHLPHLITDEELDKSTPMFWNSGARIEGLWRCSVATLLFDKRPSSVRLREITDSDK